MIRYGIGHSLDLTLPNGLSVYFLSKHNCAQTQQLPKFFLSSQVLGVGSMEPDTVKINVIWRSLKVGGQRTTMNFGYSYKIVGIISILTFFKFQGCALILWLGQIPLLGFFFFAFRITRSPQLSCRVLS